MTKNSGHRPWGFATTSNPIIFQVRKRGKATKMTLTIVEPNKVWRVDEGDIFRGVVRQDYGHLTGEPFRIIAIVEEFRQWQHRNNQSKAA